MTFTYRYRKQILISAFVFFILCGGGVFFAFFIHAEPVRAKEVLKVSKKVEKEKRKVETECYKVDIKGAVFTPGIYTISKDSRVMDVIREAGGLLENADTSVINLSKKIVDEMVIIIYTKEEVGEFQRTKEIEQVVQENCISGGSYEIKNDACIDKEDKKEERLEDVSINLATKEELMTLTGIGEAKAIAIIEYREKNGPFQKIEDIKNVDGIGESLFAKIQENITT